MNTFLVFLPIITAALFGGFLGFLILSEEMRLAREYKGKQPRTKHRKQMQKRRHAQKRVHLQ
jgi:hypothetical protein